jgi:hypothetical protein
MAVAPKPATVYIELRFVPADEPHHHGVHGIAFFSTQRHE